MSKENPKLIKNGGEGTNIGKFLRGLKDVAPEILNIASSVTGIEALKVLGDKIKGSDSISEQDKIIALEILKIDMADLADARDLQKVALSQDDLFSKRFIYYLTIGVFGFSALIVLLLFFVKIPDQNRDVINFILGVVVGTGLTGIFNYFYGSSQGSKDKMNLIK
tara:strand:- start:322 stop:816 length:495 start_codon:yes stop_codon:yes gene_type:complete